MYLHAEDLIADPNFIRGIRFHAGRMRLMFDAKPRLARLLASHQRWLLTQMAYALSMERDRLDPSSGLTASRLINEITAFKVASRNTVLSFIDELFTYRFIICEPGAERKRPRHYEAAEISHHAMVSWLSSNLHALDVLDGKDRAVEFDANPHWMRQIQPRLARHCMQDATWREPPEEIGLFLWNDAGGLIVDYLISMIDLDEQDDANFLLGEFDSRGLAADFMMSRTHLQRLIGKASVHGFMGWQTDAKRPSLWISRAFVQHYCEWQAIKFSYVDEAFHWVRSRSSAQSRDI